MQQIVVGTAGHIDHGKTSLVKALTGFDTDQLVEEKERGLTIDLGFAYLNESITIIDVPGHEKFIRNMAAGAANIHYGLIVVAADDGVMPQTIEHLDILTLLGVNKGWVAITKTDVIKDTEWIDLVELDIQERLNDRGFHALSMNRVNNLNINSTDKLKKDIASIASVKSLNSISKVFRMNIDRVFSKTGFGTVATGTVLNGEVKQGSEIEILPSAIKAKIRGIQSHGDSVNKVSSGSRAALNLSNISSSEISRGHSICSSGILKPTQKIIVNIKMIKSTNWKIKNNQRLRFHFGTSEVLGRITIFDSKNLKNGHNANAVLDLESPVAIALDDKFIIRSYSPMNTIAGGLVLETKINFSWSKIKDLVIKMPIAPDMRFKFLVQLNWRRPSMLEFWKKKFFNSNFKINISNDDELCLSEEGILFSKEAQKKAIEQVSNYFLDSYNNNPFRKIISADSIKNFLDISDIWFNIIARQMISLNAIAQSQGGFCLSNYKIDLSDHDKKDIDTLESILIKKGHEPTNINNIIDTATQNPKRVGDLVHILIQQEKIQAIAPDLYLHFEQLTYLKTIVAKHFMNSSTLTIADFKKLTGLTRKTAIPVLEYLDEHEYTHRDGNIRIAGTKKNG